MSNYWDFLIYKVKLREIASKYRIEAMKYRLGTKEVRRCH